MENILMTVENNILIIKIDLANRGGLSATQKSIKVASTGGNVDVPGQESTGIKVGVNVFVPNKNK